MEIFVQIGIYVSFSYTYKGHFLCVYCIFLCMLGRRYEERSVYSVLRMGCSVFESRKEGEEKGMINKNEEDFVNRRVSRSRCVTDSYFWAELLTVNL